MTIKVSMLILSALSDVQATHGLQSCTIDNSQRLNYIKWLVMEYPDTSVEVDPYATADVFYKKFPVIKMQMAG